MEVERNMGMIITYLAVATFCAVPFMLPVVYVIVRHRRRRDKTEVIQEDDCIDGEQTTEEL